MKNIELNISALNSSLSSSGNFVLVLQEINSARQLPIIIGLHEAQSIAVALEQLQPQRPLTHDLLLNTFNALDVQLEYVKICRIEEGAFIAVIALKTGNEKIIEIDSRTSDAIALAARTNCSIFISEVLMNEMAVIETADGKIFTEKRGQVEQFTLEELNDLLKNLLENEDYERATIIRDIISKKEQH